MLTVTYRYYMSLSEILQRHTFASVVPFDLTKDNVLLLDFTQNNPDLDTLNCTDTQIFNEYVFKKIADAQAIAGIGGYLEHRVIYRRSEHFQQTEEPRCIHLGVDVWAAAGTAVFAPLDGRVHSFRNNANFGDYGPTIILEHQLEGIVFYTLYGHLSEESLIDKTEGQLLKAGEKIAEFGAFPVNGDWPPHLHFQVIADMMGQKGDFVGVCTIADRDVFAKLCPDPSLILVKEFKQRL